jgi:hypothetical protein
MVHKQGGLIMKKLFIILGIACSLLLATNSNSTITFQGYLTNIDGSGVFGTRYMGFIIYGSKTGPDIVASGIPYREVTVYNGNYATKINLPNTVLTSLNAVSEAWVAVYVSNTNTDPTNNPAYLMSPRIQLTATPYAANVKGFNYNHGTSTATIGNITVPGTITGNVVIGAVWQ